VNERDDGAARRIGRDEREYLGDIADRRRLEAGKIWADLEPVAVPDGRFRAFSDPWTTLAPARC